ncbi:hypothetical protein SLEP1_g36142 [Rubroshorea leprosula]|uniref:Retrovirus-related Pol polyprotein from transposon TNT 1-94-like beta-barrel domain-containing protein n=1 Tax=Rubroshorea leprosula TaxID=152421 RepID=A0AAV5KQP8_9ROSI|nr:hypothetical protein SLEP1_g36142 [Rubroshorea leprosula]
MSSNNHGSSLSNPPFTGEDYNVWAIKMKTFLRGNDVWESIERGFNPPRLPQNPSLDQIKNHADYVARPYKALSFLQIGVSDEIFPRIMRAETAQDAWETLKKEYKGDERVKGQNMVTPKREFAMLKLKDTETVHQYSSKVMDMVNKIRLNGEDFLDAMVVEKMLVSLSDRFESKISAIEESCNLKELTVVELIGKLQAYEQRVVLRAEDRAEGAFQAKEKQHAAGHGRRQTPNRVEKGKAVVVQSQQLKDKFPQCPTSKQNQYRSKQKTQQAHFTNDYGEDHLFMPLHGNSSSNKDSWLVDSGCTSHMVKDKDLFTELDSSVKIKVKLANGSMVQSDGRGTVAIQSKRGIKYISNVLYIPSLSQNMLSVVQMLRNGDSVSFMHDSSHI